MCHALSTINTSISFKFARPRLPVRIPQTMSSKRSSRPANGTAGGKAPIAKKAKILFGRRDRRGQGHRLPHSCPETRRYVHVLPSRSELKQDLNVSSGSIDEPFNDQGELMKLLTASTCQRLLENVMKSNTARGAISAEFQLLLPKVVENYAAAAKQLSPVPRNISASAGGGFAYRIQEGIDCDRYPEAVAPFSKHVHKIARIPTQNSAQEAMGFLVFNQGFGGDARERFDKAMDEMFVVLAKKRKGSDGDDIDVKATLAELKGIAEGLEVFNISPTFEGSIPLLESWVR